MLVLAVSMGYGVAKLVLRKMIKPTLGPVKIKIIIFGCVYWIISFVFEATAHYNQTQKVETWIRVVLILPMALLNGLFCLWTFACLGRTIQSLQLRKQTAKLQLYKSFTSVLGAALVAAIAFVLYEMYYAVEELYLTEWDHLWFIEVGFWQILFGIIFVVIMILWRPSSHTKTYAFVSQVGQDDTEDADDSDDDNTHHNNADIGHAGDEEECEDNDCSDHSDNSNHSGYSNRQQEKQLVETK
ncbi:hypothetical protein RFI_02915 [Reticulomyxa filosa]|uniref:GOST seven transmembrane domain-containing protein n=1 Tax=Reticulomyxa filosa TaxID=46433 RepID=X6P6L7_RETFI|nr:hypothetical protein RFI_02915 [Reticulomyxa filosa]|eukprot:ETO34180.1 hypothetical protein RFI_02915 [Reticulomyxa filosa]